MKYYVRHISSYAYEFPVTLSAHVARLKPRETPYQKVSDVKLTIDPQTDAARDVTDAFGNTMTLFTVEKTHDALTVTSEFHAQTRAPDYPNPAETPAWEEVAQILKFPQTDALLEAAQMSAESCFIQKTAAAREYALQSFAKNRPVLEAAEDLTHRIYKDFLYDPTATSVATPVDEVLKLRRGVCQDFAHLAIACLRSLGLAARYVSGYIRTHKADDSAMVGGDASHAWFSVFVPSICGWVDLDPTNNMYLGEEHVTIGWGRDFDDMSPVKGVMTGGGKHSFSVDVLVAPQGDD